MQASLDALDDLVVLINKRLPVKAKRQNVRSSLRSGTILSSQAEQEKAAKLDAEEILAERTRTKRKYTNRSGTTN